MAIKSSGQLAFTEIVAEFPDTPPHSMSEFYRGGGKVPDANTNIPTSGQISFSNFYGATNRVVAEITISSNQQNYVFNPQKLASYSAGITDAVIYINEGVYIWSDSTFSPALTISGWNNNDTVKVVNKGFIIGKGGQGADMTYNNTSGGTAYSVGTNGGPAIKVIGSLLTAYDNTWPTAYIAGGGGGGAAMYVAGLYACGGGGAGGGRGGNVVVTNQTNQNKTGGAGGGLGLPGSAGAGDNDIYNAGAGGGRILPGVGGQASLSTIDGLSRGGGSGGTGSWVDARNYPGFAPNGLGSSGGAGGGWGAPGTPSWIFVSNQLSAWMPSYGNGGSSNEWAGIPSGLSIEITTVDGNLTSTITNNRPHVVDWYQNQFGMIVGFSDGGYAIELGGGGISLIGGTGSLTRMYGNWGLKL